MKLYKPLAVTKRLPKLFITAVAAVLLLAACPDDSGTTTTPPPPSDTTPPGNVTDITATVVPGTPANTVDVTLTWTNPTDDDFSHVEITWTPNAPAAPVRVENATTYTATALPELENNGRYTFTIVSVDTTGNKPDETAGQTAPTTSVSTDTTPPAAVDAGTVTGSIVGTTATLNWTNPADVDFSHVEITWTPNAPTAPVRVPASGTGTPGDPGSYANTEFDNTPATEYTFLIAAVDTNGNRSTETSFAITSASADTTPPGNVTDITATVVPGTPANTVDVTITWTNPTDDDFSHVEITWTPNAPTAPVRVENATTYTATALPELENNGTYTFTIVSVDTAGNKPDETSGQAAPTTSVSTDTTPPAAVDAGTVTGSIAGTTATLNWTNPADVDFSHVEITWTPNAPTAPVRVPASGTGTPGDPGSYTNTEFDNTPATEYTFLIAAVDTNGNRSTETSFAITTASLDTTPPGAVTDLTAVTSQAGDATVSWTNPSDDDFALVAITWSPETTGATATAQPVEVDGPATTTTISGFDSTVAYTFTVVARDTSGNASTPVTFELDKTPPGAVTDLEAAVSEDGDATVSWTNPSDADFALVAITWAPETTGANATAQPVEVDGPATTTTISGFDATVSYTFTVVARDSSGNDSSAETFEVDKTPPGRVSGLSSSINVGRREVSLSWTNPTDDDYSRTLITWSPETNTTQPVEVTGTAGAVGTSTIPGFSSGEEYDFFVVAVDTSGNESAARTTRVDLVPPGLVTNLTATVANGTATLTWTDPVDDDLDSLLIDWTAARGGPLGVGTLEINAGVERATVTGLSNTETYTFRVASVDVSGNTSNNASFTVTGLVLPEVTVLSSEQAQDGVVNLTWTYPTTTALGTHTLSHAQVTWAPGGGTTTQPLRVPASGSASAGGSGSATIEGLTDGVRYTFRVSIIDSASNVSIGATTAITADAAITAPVVTAFNLGSGGIRLSWTNPANDPTFTLDGPGTGTNSSKIDITWGTNSSTTVTENVEQVDITTGLTVGTAVTFNATFTDGVGHTADIVAVTATPSVGHTAIFSLGEQDGDFGYAACQNALDDTSAPDSALGRVVARLRDDGYSKAVFFGSTNTYALGTIGNNANALLPVAGNHGNPWARALHTYTDNGSAAVVTQTYAARASGTDITVAPTIGGVVNLHNNNAHSWRAATAANLVLGGSQVIAQLGITDANDRFWSNTRSYRVHSGNNCSNAGSNAANAMGAAGGSIGLSQDASAACNNTYHVFCVAH